MIFYPFVCLPFTFFGWLDLCFLSCMSLWFFWSASKNTFFLKNKTENDYKGLNKVLLKLILRFTSLCSRICSWPSFNLNPNNSQRNSFHSFIVLLLAIVNSRKNGAKNKMTRTQAWIRKHIVTYALGMERCCLRFWLWGWRYKYFLFKAKIPLTDISVFIWVRTFHTHVVATWMISVNFPAAHSS